MQLSVTSCYSITVCCVSVVSFVAVTLCVSSHDPSTSPCSAQPHTMWFLLVSENEITVVIVLIPRCPWNFRTIGDCCICDGRKSVTAASGSVHRPIARTQNGTAMTSVHVCFVIDSVWGPLCMLLYDCHTCSSILCTTLVTEMSTWLISVLPWALFQVIVHHQAHPQLQVGVNLALETSLRISSSA